MKSELAVARPSLMGGRVTSLSGICSSATIVAPYSYQIEAFFTCLVTLPFASSCETACSVCYGLHVIMSVNTHLRIIIFIAVLHNAAEQSHATRPPSGTVKPRPTNHTIIIINSCQTVHTILRSKNQLQQQKVIV